MQDTALAHPDILHLQVAKVQRKVGDNIQKRGYPYSIYSNSKIEVQT
jgi:hypothetical protein